MVGQQWYGMLLTLKSFYPIFKVRSIAFKKFHFTIPHKKWLILNSLSFLASEEWGASYPTSKHLQWQIPTISNSIAKFCNKNDVAERGMFCLALFRTTPFLLILFMLFFSGAMRKICRARILRIFVYLYICIFRGYFWHFSHILTHSYRFSAFWAAYFDCVFWGAQP